MGKQVKTKRAERVRGVLGKSAVWCYRNPGMAGLLSGAPLTVGTSVAEVGALTTGYIAAGVVGAGVAWRSADRDSYDAVLAKRFRSFRRRWGAYRGGRWNDVMDACGLTRQHGKTGQIYYPRVAKVQAVTPSIDVLTVRLCVGVSERKFLGAVDELAPALNAEALKISRVKGKNKLIKMVLIRSNPFEDVEVEATEIPDDADEIDYHALPIGEDELGGEVLLDLLGQHLLVYGQMGAGKAGGLWNVLRAMGPGIREGLVDIFAIDPKQVELEPARPVFRRLVTEQDDFLPVVVEFRDRMKQRKEKLQAEGKRKVPGVTAEYPLQVLAIDEMAMVLALSSDAREINKVLMEVMTQGRALGFVVMGYIQAAEKDILTLRDFFTRRICLSASSDTHVNMVLGDGMRERGALADKIQIPEEAGVGYMVCSDFKATGKGRVKFYRPGDPMRIRLGNVTDADLAELVAECTRELGEEAVALPTVVRGPDEWFEPLEVAEDGDGLDFEPGELDRYAEDGQTAVLQPLMPSTIELLDAINGRATDPADVAWGA